MRPNYRLRIIPSFLWMDEPVGYTVEEVEAGLYRYVYFSCERADEETSPEAFWACRSEEESIRPRGFYHAFPLHGRPI